MFVKVVSIEGGVSTVLTAERFLSPVYRRPVVLKLHLGECGEGTTITEQRLPISPVFTFLLVFPVLVSHVTVVQLLPGGLKVTSVTAVESLLLV